MWNVMTCCKNVLLSSISYCWAEWNWLIVWLKSQWDLYNVLNGYYCSKSVGMLGNMVMTAIKYRTYFADNDGKIEIVVGFSDRVVRTYKWYEHAGDKSGEIVILRKWTLNSQVVRRQTAALFPATIFFWYHFGIISGSILYVIFTHAITWSVLVEDAAYYWL